MWGRVALTAEVSFQGQRGGLAAGAHGLGGGGSVVSTGLGFPVGGVRGEGSCTFLAGEVREG